MKATEELREQLISMGYGINGRCIKLLDRIDAEHEASMTTYRIDYATASKTNETLAKKLEAIKETHIALPVDKNGEVIHIGDMMENDQHIPRKACGFFYPDDETVWVTLECTSGSIDACELQHFEPESQEKIDADVRDIAEEWIATAEEDIVKVTNDVLDLLRRQRDLDGAK